MKSRGALLVGYAGTVLLVVLALWTWQNAADLARDWAAARPPLFIWAARSAAIGFAAAAQGLLLTIIVKGLYRRDVVSDVLRLCALLVFMVAGVSAIALGLAGG